MKWSIPEIHIESEFKIDFKTPCLWLGSCFSDNIYERGRELGLPFEQARFGTLFHPLVLSEIVRRIAKNELKNIYAFERDQFWFSWLASTNFYAEKETELQKIWAEEIERLHEFLLKTEVLFITLGTSYAYRHKELNVYVGNCHKIPQENFEKCLLSLEDMAASWLETLEILQKIRPELKIVFTVSPVRHLRDGVVENTRSKARLQILVEQLSTKENVFYFPAYEILIDELREYRFYTEDLVHPSKLAVDVIWNRFSKTYFSNETQQLILKIKNYLLFFNHKNRIESSIQKQLYEDRKAEWKVFLERNPEIRLL